MNLSWLLWRLFSVLLSLLLWLVLPASAQQPAAAQPELEAAARAFVAEMAEGQSEKAAGRFDETMTRAMPLRKGGNHDANQESLSTAMGSLV